MEKQIIYTCMIISKIQESFKHSNINENVENFEEKKSICKTKNQHMILYQLSVGQNKISTFKINHF